MYFWKGEELENWIFFVFMKKVLHGEQQRTIEIFLEEAITLKEQFLRGHM